MTLPSPDLTRKAEAVYNRIRAMAESADDVLGFFLTGSRGKGLATPFSDYDCYLIVPDDVTRQKYMELLADYDVRSLTLLPKDGVDMHIYSIDEFRNFGNWGGWGHWDGYSFAHLKVDIDRSNGEIQRLIDQKALIPEDAAYGVAWQAIHDYMNHVYRSLKTLRDSSYIAHRLEAALSINFLFDVLFCIHGRRRRPWYKYLVWEIEMDGFSRLPMSDKELLEKILTILTTADYNTQIELYEIASRLFRAMGFGDRSDYWKGPIEQAIAGIAMVDASKVEARRPVERSEREIDLQAKIEKLGIEVGELEIAARSLRTEKSELEKAALTLQTEKSELEKAELALQTEKSELEKSALALQTEKSELEKSALALQTEKSELEKAAAALQTENKRLIKWQRQVSRSRSFRISQRLSSLYRLMLRMVGKKALT